MRRAVVLLRRPLAEVMQLSRLGAASTSGLRSIQGQHSSAAESPITEACMEKGYPSRYEDLDDRIGGGSFGDDCGRCSANVGGRAVCRIQSKRRFRLRRRPRADFHLGAVSVPGSPAHRGSPAARRASTSGAVTSGPAEKHGEALLDGEGRVERKHVPRCAARLVRPPQRDERRGQPTHVQAKRGFASIDRHAASAACANRCLRKCARQRAL
jgi:hypothetical protein